jgi:CBS domain-containing protein
MSPHAIPQPHGSYLMPAFERATVSDAMHPGVLSCGADSTLTEVARMMATRHVHCIVVMGLAHDVGEELVWGVISDLDLVRAGVEQGADAVASDLALAPIITVEPTMLLREAGRLMVANGASHVVVIDRQLGRPTGILSTLDIAGLLAWGEG